MVEVPLSENSRFTPRT